MRIVLCVFIVLFFLMARAGVAQSPLRPTGQFTLVIHGGAGTIKKSHLSKEEEKAYRETMEDALAYGQKMLAKGASSIDVVEAVVMRLEDSPLFNAGRGSVYSHTGQHEMDAAVMDGRTKQAGAVAGVRHVRNPVVAARLVMDSTEHVLLAGAGAERFIKDMELPIKDSVWFATERRHKQWQRALARETIELDHSGKNEQGSLHDDEGEQTTKFGTVGAVALDRYGNVAAATSTGGLTNKKYGRIGDSPLIGAGTWAENETAALSCTGRGEYFIRQAAAHDIASRIRYQHLSLDSAASIVIQQELKPVGGKGGVIGVDQQGNITMTFNTRGMYRGYVRSGGKPKVFIFKDE